jgi:hypothetical protein
MTTEARQALWQKVLRLERELQAARLTYDAKRHEFDQAKKAYRDCPGND